MSYETLQFDVRDGVAHITLDRPDAANSIDVQMAKDLMYAAMRCDDDPEVRAVLLASTGKLFCAGGDLVSFTGSDHSMPAQLMETTTYLHAAVSRFSRGDAPVVAAVGGTAAGAGFSLVCACDLVVCSDHARFTMAYTGVGLTPDGSSTYYLPRLVGHRRTLELMLTNRVLSAQEALDWGIVNQVVPLDELAATSEEWAAQLARGATAAFGRTKRLVHASGSESLETQMELETRAITDSGRTHDAREGTKAFLEKREPKFEGR